MLYCRGKGKYQAGIEELWNSLVPPSGQANTVQGELVRCIRRLESEYVRNGNGNWDMGFRMLTNFLYKHLRNKTIFDELILEQIELDIQDIRLYGNGKKLIDYSNNEDAYDRVTDRVYEWCQHHTMPISHTKNPKLYR